MVESEGDVAAGHGQSLYRVQAGRIFGAWGPQELAARGHLVEQAGHLDPSAWRERCRPLVRRLAMVDGDPPAVRAPTAAVDRQAGDAGD